MSDTAARGTEQVSEAAASEVEEAYAPDPQVAKPPPWTEEEDWQPPETSSEFDWVQLDTGEWLKGNLESLRDRKVTFDSDELGSVELDFSDIVRFQLPRGHSYRLKSRVVHRGAAEMRNGVVRVRTPTGIAEFHRDEILGVVQGTGRELDRWSIWGPLDIDISFIWDRVNKPEPDATGVRPKSDDVRLTLGLGLDF